MIHTWAPPSENETEKYIQYVVARAGFHADQVFTFDESTVSTIIAAMVRMESGRQMTAGEWAAAWEMVK
jgi:hypothetical protein